MIAEKTAQTRRQQPNLGRSVPRLHADLRCSRAFRRWALLAETSIRAATGDASTFYRSRPVSAELAYGVFEYLRVCRRDPRSGRLTDGRGQPLSARAVAAAV